MAFVWWYSYKLSTRLLSVVQGINWYFCEFIWSSLCYQNEIWHSCTLWYCKYFELGVPTYTFPYMALKDLYVQIWYILFYTSMDCSDTHVFGRICNGINPLQILPNTRVSEQSIKNRILKIEKRLYICINYSILFCCQLSCEKVHFLKFVVLRWWYWWLNQFCISKKWQYISMTILFYACLCEAWFKLFIWSNNDSTSII